MSDNASSGSSGLGLPMVLFLIFLVLKLCDVIAWSWWWVSSPLWIPVALLIVILILAAIWAGIYSMFGTPTSKR